MLNAPELRHLPATAVFQEDAQTYYGKGWFGQTVLWQMIQHHGPRAPYEKKPPEQWGEWDQTSEGYRLCCTGVSWIGTALAARPADEGHPDLGTRRVLRLLRPLDASR